MPVATSSVRGGVKIGYSGNGKNYPVQLDSNEKMFVNVPWTNENSNYLTANSVSIPDPTPTANWDRGVVIGSVAGKEFAFTMPSNPNTHYATHIYAGDSTNTAGNATTANGSTYLKIFDDTTVRGKIGVIGAGTVGVASDNAGNITITGAAPSVSANNPTLSTWGETYKIGTINGTEFNVTMPANPNTNTTYTLSQDTTNGHIIKLTPSGGGAEQTVTIPDNNTNYYHSTGSWNGLTYTADNTNANGIELAFTIPTGTSATTVAKGDHTHTFASLTSKPTTISGYGITDAYTKTEIDGKIASVFHYKGTKATVSALPTSGNTTGDVWHVTADGGEYVWNGSAWEELGTVIDLSGYAQLSGASFTGPVNFGDSVTADDISTGSLLVTGSSSFTNNAQFNTINGVTVGSSPKFTDTITTVSTSGSGNAITAISASNGAITATKGITFLTAHQDISGKADKTATVSNVAYDSTNAKITKTINGTTSDVVTVATLKSALGTMPPDTHTHNYAGSSTPGGTATSAATLTSLTGSDDASSTATWRKV